ncbi:MAG: hypothetical protein H6Q33_4211 [Deltaproteobacteria bacterium]|nr:hypothetical protein [Deltaproteobacteria bacterium]
MHVNLTLCLAAIAMLSCAREPTTQPPTLTRPVTYYFGGGITGYGTELSINETGKATAWSIALGRELIGERQLSQVEVIDLETLLTPFCQYQNSYGLQTADGMVSSISYGCNHKLKDVVVYNSDVADVPPGWFELEEGLQVVMASLRPASNSVLQPSAPREKIR